MTVIQTRIMTERKRKLVCVSFDAHPGVYELLQRYVELENKTITKAIVNAIKWKYLKRYGTETIRAQIEGN
jgi:hypothetical protein